MSSIVALLVALVSITSTELQSASRSQPEVVRPACIVGPSKVIYPDTPKRKGYLLQVEQDQEAKQRNEVFSDDFFIMRILSTDGVPEVQVEKRFESSYGQFELCAVDLTGDGTEEFVLVTGQGHGTNVRGETLRVLLRSGKDLRQVLEIPASAYFGIERWWYERTFVDVNGDGVIDIRLILRHPPMEEIEKYSIDDPQLIPRVTLQEYRFDRGSGKFVLHRSVKNRRS